MFDEKKLEKKFSEKSRSILGELTRQKSVSQSFSVNDFDPSFALVDLERLKKGEIHLQDFLTTYNLIVKFFKMYKN